jgi:hypothetical protein
MGMMLRSRYDSMITMQQVWGVWSGHELPGCALYASAGQICPGIVQGAAWPALPSSTSRTGKHIG